MKNGLTHINYGTPISSIDENKLKDVDEAYICTDFRCNLNCPHCTLKDIKVTEEFIPNIIESIHFLQKCNPKVSFTLFGGEPSLLRDEVLLKIREAIGDSDYSISTNLIKFSDTFLQLLKESDLPDTSWNPHRFPTSELYNQWRNNVEVLKNNKIKFELMITLTQDLIDIEPQKFIEKVLEWGVHSVKLEFMIGDDNLNPSDVDEWLVKLYHLWNNNIELKDYNNVLFKRVEDVLLNHVRWEGNCENTVTIMPNGNIKERCPYYEYTTDKAECLICEYYDYCKGGCPLQDRCVFPKKLFEEMKKDFNV